MANWTEWSATKIDNAKTCMRILFYVYGDHVPRQMSVRLAAGLYIHAGCAKFLDPSRKRPHFLSAQRYAGQRVGAWKSLIITSRRYGGQDIQEEWDGELYASSETVIRPCSEHFYEMFSERENPLAVEKRFRLQIGDFTLVGTFDAIDKKLTYIDFKTDSKRPRVAAEERKTLSFLIDSFNVRSLSREERRMLQGILEKNGLGLSDVTLLRHVIRKHFLEQKEWEPREDTLLHKYQFTLYTLALPFVVAQDPFLLEQMELTSAQRRALQENPLSLLEEVQGKYARLQNGKMYGIPKRRKEDIVEMLNTLESCALRAEQGDFAHSRGQYCHWCHVRGQCDKDTLEGKVLLPEEMVRKSRYLLFPPRRELKVHTDVPSPIRLVMPLQHPKKRDMTSLFPFC